MTANPQLDFTKIDLPTDTITLGDLRRRFPTADRHFLDHFYEDLDTMIFAQEGFVRLGFAGVVAGKKGQEEVLNHIAPEGTREEAESFLIDRYVHYGVAGPETAKQIIRRLQEMGAQQARAQLGRTGP